MVNYVAATNMIQTSSNHCQRTKDRTLKKQFSLIGAELQANQQQVIPILRLALTSQEIQGPILMDQSRILARLRCI